MILQTSKMANKKEKQIPYIIAAPAEPIKVTLAPHELTSRYKTKQIVVQSFGNRTVFQDLERTAKKYMHIPASCTFSNYVAHLSDLIMYLGYQLGVPTKHEATAKQQYSLSGIHDPKKLSKLCQDFVKEVLLCPRCKLPEIALSIENDSKTKKVKAKCRSCGFQGQMLGNNPKFANFVIKNPPPVIQDFGNRMENDFLSKFGNVNVSDGAFSSGSSSSSSDEENEEISFDIQVRQALQATLPSSQMIQIEEAVKNLLMPPRETSQVVFQCLFGAEGSEKDLIATVGTHKQFLQLFLHSSPERQVAFLEYFIQRIGTISATQQKVALKKLYEEDILEEEELIQWFDKCGPSLEGTYPAAMESVKTFIEWLRQPDESDEE